jgi:hypothetical protein
MKRTRAEVSKLLLFFNEIYARFPSIELPKAAFDTSASTGLIDKIRFFKLDKED